MNKLTKRLAEQACKQSTDGYPVTIPYNVDFVNVFAELILKEVFATVIQSDIKEHT